MLKDLFRRLRPDPVKGGNMCNVRTCPVWTLYARTVLERDRIRAERNQLEEALHEMKEREAVRPQKPPAEPTNTYQELERAWGKI